MSITMTITMELVSNDSLNDS